jgi:hypothetical protein
MVPKSIYEDLVFKFQFMYKNSLIILMPLLFYNI